MLYIQLTQAQSQVKAPVNSINNHCLKRRFLLFHTQEKNCKKNRSLNERMHHYVHKVTQRPILLQFYVH